MYLPSRLQKYPGIGRVVSAVIGFALSKASSVRLIQMLRVSLNGLMKAMNLPSGEIWAPLISGSPKINSRSMMGTVPDFCAKPAGAESRRTHNATVKRDDQRT